MSDDELLESFSTQAEQLEVAIKALERIKEYTSSSWDCDAGNASDEATKALDKIQEIETRCCKKGKENGND